MIVWSSLTREERLAFVKPLWLDGMSALEISLLAHGASRNAIIGYVARNGLNRNDPGLTRALAHHNTRAIAAPSVRRNPHASAGLNMKGAKAGGPPAVVFGPVSPGPKKPFHGRADAFSPLPGIEPVPFLERTGLQCRWPVGGEGAAMLCCSAPRPIERPYCDAHTAISSSKWQPEPDQEVEPLKWRLAR